MEIVIAIATGLLWIAHRLFLQRVETIRATRKIDMQIARRKEELGV